VKALSLTRRVPLDLSSPCWPWPGYVPSDHYPHVMIDGQRKYVHRVSYQLHVGPVPRGWEIDHVCHTAAVSAGLCAGPECAHRACWNPAHLEAVTSRENSLRGNHPLFAVARRKVCKRGHDLTDDRNVWVRPDGRRRCRVCKNATHREWSKKQCAR
jgi:hypothetical protein